MRRELEWQSAVEVTYGQGTGPAILRYAPNTSRFEYCLPGDSWPVLFDATSLNEVDLLKNRLEATLGSAADLRDSVAFVDRYAAPRH